MIVDSGGAKVGCVSDVVATGRATSESSGLWWQESFGTAAGGQGFTISKGGYTTF